MKSIMNRIFRTDYTKKHAAYYVFTTIISLIYPVLIILLNNGSRNDDLLFSLMFFYFILTVLLFLLVFYIGNTRTKLFPKALVLLVLGYSIALLCWYLLTSNVSIFGLDRKVSFAIISSFIVLGVLVFSLVDLVIMNKEKEPLSSIKHANSANQVLLISCSILIIQLTIRVAYLIHNDGLKDKYFGIVGSENPSAWILISALGLIAINAMLIGYLGKKKYKWMIFLGALLVTQNLTYLFSILIYMNDNETLQLLISLIPEIILLALMTPKIILNLKNRKTR